MFREALRKLGIKIQRQVKPQWNAYKSFDVSCLFISAFFFTAICIFHHKDLLKKWKMAVEKEGEEMGKTKKNRSAAKRIKISRRQGPFLFKTIFLKDLCLHPLPPPLKRGQEKGAPSFTPFSFDPFFRGRGKRRRNGNENE